MVDKFFVRSQVKLSNFTCIVKKNFISFLNVDLSQNSKILDPKLNNIRFTVCKLECVFCFISDLYPFLSGIFKFYENYFLIVIVNAI